MDTHRIVMSDAHARHVSWGAVATNAVLAVAGAVVLAAFVVGAEAITMFVFVALFAAGAAIFGGQLRRGRPSGRELVIMSLFLVAAGSALVFGINAL